MTLGKTLHDAREAKGLTPLQLADETHILVQIINGLENEDFSRIPAQIYGRGFIRTISGILKLDAAPLLSIFNDLWAHPEKRGMDIPVAVEAAPSPSPVIPTVDTTPAATSVSVAAGPDLFAPAATPAPIEESTNRKIENSPVIPPAAPIEESTNRKIENSPAPAPAPASRRQYGELFEYAETAQPEAPAESAIERFRSTLSNVSHSVVSTSERLPRNFGRILILSAVSAILVGLMIWAIAFLYRATSALPANAPKTERAAESVPAAGKTDKPEPRATPEPATRRAPARPVNLRSTGDKVPPLYID